MKIEKSLYPVAGENIAIFAILYTAILVTGSDVAQRAEAEQSIGFTSFTYHIFRFEAAFIQIAPFFSDLRFQFVVVSYCPQIGFAFFTVYPAI